MLDTESNNSIKGFVMICITYNNYKDMILERMTCLIREGRGQGQIFSLFDGNRLSEGVYRTDLYSI